VTPAGKLLDEATWTRDKHQWLPSSDDGEFIGSLMKQVTEPGKFANWIAPPRIGIDNKPGDFEYVKIAA
jgi:benzoyl-CoA 2,3-dioxygenase component B